MDMEALRTGYEDKLQKVSKIMTAQDDVLARWKVRTHIVIKQFHHKEGAWKGAEQLVYQLAGFVLVKNIFLLPSVLFIEYTPKPCIQRGDDSSLFCVHISRYLLTWAGAHLFYNYGFTCIFIKRTTWIMSMFENVEIYALLWYIVRGLRILTHVLRTILRRTQRRFPAFHSPE